jgi:predicted  nucleic acid-binding Zn-ribbon protein
VNIEQTILERFMEREKEIKAECEKLDKEMDKKRREQEHVQADAQAKLEKARAALAVMKADYHALMAELEAKAKADLEVTAITGEKVKEGAATLRQFFEEGLSGNALEQKARAEARAKLAQAVELIRAKAAEIFQLELTESQARKETIFAATFPGQTQVKKLKAEIEMLERGIGEVFTGYFVADTDVERAKADIRLCSGRSIDSVTWDSLTYNELCELRLDPRITNVERFKALDGLEGIIASAKPGERYYLVMAHGSLGREAGFVVRQLDADRGMMTTTTPSEPVKK